MKMISQEQPQAIMDEPSDVREKNSSSKKRPSIYGERLAISLRMGRSLNERLMAYCNSVPMPANFYVNALISAAMARTDPLTACIKQANVRSEVKANLSIRLDPDLRRRLTEYCTGVTPSISVNSFVCGIVLKDLNQKDRGAVS